LRTQLHEAAGHYLERQTHAVDFNLDLLAHHYWHSDNFDKKVEYQRRAGEAAQAAYANEAAIEYFERLAEIIDEAERAEILLRLGEVLELVGEWDRAMQVESEALQLAGAAQDIGLVGWCQTSLAEVARKQGRYDDAAELLESAAVSFDQVGEAAGKGRVLHLAGTVAAQRGELETARLHYEESLAIREQLADQAALASLLSNLGVVAEYSGNLGEARGFHERALAQRIEIGDRWAIAVSNTNLGMIAVLQQRYDAARDLFTEAMRLNEEVGDTWMVAVCHNNLGNAYRGLGDTAAARSHYAESAEEYLAYGDRWAAAFLLEDVALLAAQNGRPTLGIELLGAADSMRNEIDTPRADSLENELEAGVFNARPERAATERESARRRGRQWSFEQSLAAVVDYCRGSQAS
jgi:tetratricopeptide (TPR) repeat protein